MPAATSQTYRVQTGVMYTNDQLAGVAQPKDASVTRTLPANSNVVESVEIKTAYTDGRPGQSGNDIASLYVSQSVTALPTQPRLNY